MEVLRTDVAIIGGGLGACAAALAAARLGRRVILTEETHWIGGQLTNQAVPPDEHPWIESFGATASYRALREGIRAYYRTHTPLTPEARSNTHLNPGGGWVSRLCHDPRIAVAVQPASHISTLSRSDDSGAGGRDCGRVCMPSVARNGCPLADGMLAAVVGGQPLVASRVVLKAPGSWPTSGRGCRRNTRRRVG